VLGVISLILFFIILLGSIRKWIPQDVLPLQSSLVLGALLLLGLALIFGQPFRPAQLLASTTLHPITATIAGFLLAGAVEAGGGFAAASRLLTRMGRGFLGLSGTVILLVNIPTIFAMPCGRVWAAALIPAAMMFGFELARQRNDMSLVPVVVFGLIVNAAASCGPSPLGGIGMMGEGTAGFRLHTFSNPQQMAIMVITLLTMAAIAFDRRITVNPRMIPKSEATPKDLPRTAYFTFGFYMIGLGVVFVTEPPVPIQTILLVMTILIMMVGKVSMKELISGVILHPVTAMVAGFIMAGALLITGGFDTLIECLSWLAIHTPLGYIGMSILLIYLPVIFPMPCGRIIAAALLPGVIMFGQHVAHMTGCPQCLPAMLVAFILCCAASCAPSPLGGIGGIGEGNLGLKSNVSSRSLQIGIMLGAPAAAMIVAYLGLSTAFFRLSEGIVALALGMVSGLVINLVLGYRIYKPGGILGGLLVGALIMVL